MPADYEKAKEVFLAALERPPEKRDAFVAQECGDDEELRASVVKLLQAHREDGSLFHPNGARQAVTADFHPVTEGPGTVIGSYKLLEKIGEGGFGVVFLAEQTEPVRRKVALKILKPGMDTRQVVARFEAERQALAIMDHQHIAKVFDGGSTPSGRPYFVMELVKGVPITDFCDLNHLTPRQRMGLFIPVCQAVQHAHQKGIIHRDLKPSNVLVSRHDTTPMVKVIDFGVAKALGQELTDKTLFTGMAQMIGTPLYMSPEQAGMSDLDVDTRSDIYSLGVLLFELLTGSTPFTKERFQKAAYDEIRRIIREEEPPKPSTRLSESKDSLPSISAQRQMEPAKLTKLIRGELDWIVMKALEKDRNRRYETANGFAMDVQRYLADEPVLAGPPSAAYRFKKFARRHKGPVLAVSLVLLALVGGVIGTTAGLIEAQRQRDRAEIALDNEAEQRRVAERAATAERLAREQSDRRLAQIEKANAILGSVFRDLDPRALEGEKPLSALLGERLDQAVVQLEGEAIGDLLTVARMQQILGESLLGLGHPQKAVGLFIKAYDTLRAGPGLDHRDTLSAMNNLATAYQALMQLDRALPLFEEVLKIQRTKLGPDHSDTLVAMNNLALAYRLARKLDQALPLHEDVLKLRRDRNGPDHLDTLTALSNLARAYQDARQFDRALPLHEEVLKRWRAQLGPDHPHTLTAMGNLAAAYGIAGKLDLAVSLHEEGLRLWRAKLGPDHPDTLVGMNNLALAYKNAGKLDLALPLYEEALRLRRARLGSEHPQTLISLNNLALAYRAAKKHDQALPLFEEMHKVRRTQLGPDHPNTLNTMNHLAEAYQATGKLDLAVPLQEEILKLQRARVGPDHRDTVTAMNNLAVVYKAAGKLDQALPLFEEALKLRRAKLGPDHLQTVGTMNSLALAYLAAKKFDPAQPLLEEVLKHRKAKLGPDHPDTITTMNNLANAYQDSGQLDRALSLYEEAAQVHEKRQFQHEHAGTIVANTCQCLEAMKQFDRAEVWRRKWLAVVKQKSGGESPAYASALATLGQNLLKQEKWTAAEAVVREALAIREKREPEDWSKFNTQSLLGTALLGQKKYAKAEPLLLSGYEGMKQREQAIPAASKVRLIETLERLVRLYEAWGKPDEAAKWREKLPPKNAGAEKK